MLFLIIVNKMLNNSSFMFSVFHREAARYSDIDNSFRCILTLHSLHFWRELSHNMDTRSLIVAIETCNSNDDSRTKRKIKMSSLQEIIRSSVSSPYTSLLVLYLAFLTFLNFSEEVLLNCQARFFLKVFTPVGYLYLYFFDLLHTDFQFCILKSFITFCDNFIVHTSI